MALSLFYGPTFSGGTVAVGGGTATATVGGLLVVTTTQAATAANTDETTLWTWPLPPGTLNANGRGVRIKVWLTTSANGNVKTGKLYFGSTVVCNRGGADNAKTQLYQADVFRTGAETQHTISDGRNGGVNIDAVVTTPAEDTTGAITIKFTGTNGTALANEIVFKGALVESL